MKKTALGPRALGLAVAISAAGLSASAVAAAEPEISANVALTSDYVWRGESQSDEELALQGGFDYEHASGFYIGTWGSSVDFGGDEDIELDYYLGFASELNGISYDIGYVYLDYPGSDDTDGWWEVYASLSKDFEAFSGELGATYTTDFVASGEDGYYLYLSGSVPVGLFSIGGTVGYQSHDSDYIDDDSWIHYQLGIATSYAGVDFDLSYHDTNVDDYELMEDRIVFTIAKAF